MLKKNLKLFVRSVMMGKKITYKLVVKGIDGETLSKFLHAIHKATESDSDSPNLTIEEE